MIFKIYFQVDEGGGMDNITLKCSFCGVGAQEATRLVTGPYDNICERCVESFKKLFQKDTSSDVGIVYTLCSFCLEYLEDTEEGTRGYSESVIICQTCLVKAKLSLKEYDKESTATDH